MGKEKILVIGSSGFIGSHTVERFTELHKLCYEFDIKRSKDEDIRSLESTKRTLNATEPSVIIHLAASQGIQASRHNPLVDLETNGLGMLNLVTGIKQLKMSPYMVFTSTAQIYGEPLYLPIDEQHPIAPKSPYAHTKYLAEGYLQLFYENYVILRLFNVYGPRQSLGNVIPDFIYRAKTLPSRTPFTVYGSEKDVRDFVFVDDVVDIFEILICEQPNGIYNIGSGHGAPIKDLAEKILSLTGKNLEIEFAGRQSDKISKMVANTNKFRSSVPWKPKVSLEEGLKRCVTARNMPSSH